MSASSSPISPKDFLIQFSLCYGGGAMKHIAEKVREKEMSYASSARAQTDSTIAITDFDRFWCKLERAVPEAIHFVKGSKEEKQTFLDSIAPQLHALDLRGARLSELPIEISLLTHLTELDLSGNALRDLPPLPPGLKKLKVNDNRLEAIPKLVYGLSQLQTLELMNNSIKELDEEIDLLSELSDLRIDGNQIARLPQSFTALQRLTHFSATANALGSLPEHFGDLKELNYLYLFQNKLETLPASFSALENLRVASLPNNCLSALPSGMEKLSQLQTLILSNNLLEQIAVKLMPALHTLMLDGNPITRIGDEMFNLEILKHLSCPSPDVLTDGATRKFLLPAIIEGACSEELSKTYWALDNEKWREFIDGEFHPLGEDAFDKPRYNEDGTLSRQAEPGYKESMYSASHFLSQNWKRALSPEFYLEIHKHTCAHFTKKIALVGIENVGVFRSKERNLSAKFRSLEEMAKVEFQKIDALLKIHFGPTFGLGTWRLVQTSFSLHYHPMDRRQIALIFQFFTMLYHREMEESLSPKERLKATGGLIQKLEWLHSTPDGCGRTDTALLNFLLTSCGLHPVLLSYPYRSSHVELDKWVEILEEGLSLWETALSHTPKI